MPILRRPWTEQPQEPAALSSDFGRIVSAVLGSTWPSELVGPTGLSNISGTRAPSYGLMGVSSARMFVSGRLTGSDYTLVSVAYGGTFSSNGNLIGSHQNPPQNFQLRLNSTSGRFEFIRFDDPITAAWTVTTPSAVDVSKPYVVIATTRARVTAIYAGNIGGEKFNSAAGTIPNNAPSAFTAAHVLCYGERGVGTPFDGITYAGAAIDRAITPAQAFELVCNPWQLFDSWEVDIPTAAGAPAVPTLSLPTFVPGSITSAGFRPRVTAS